MTNSEDEVRQALEEVLKMHNIDLDLQPALEEGRKEQHGDFATIINKTQQRLDELNEKAEAIYDRIGMNREQLDAYASNPNNFSKDQWDALQKVREACEKYKQQAQTRIGEEHLVPKSKKKGKKETHRFGKKKHWLPL